SRRERVRVGRRGGAHPRRQAGHALRLRLARAGPLVPARPQARPPLPPLRARRAGQGPAERSAGRAADPARGRAGAVRLSASGQRRDREMAGKHRVGVLGLGHWYSAYRLGWTLAGYPRAELAAVACADGAKRDAFAGAFGVDGHASFDELLARDDVDIV